MSGNGAGEGSTLHLVFSDAGLREALPFLRAGDRVLRMHSAVSKGMAAKDDVTVPAPVFHLAAPGERTDGGIDEPTMVRWCVEAARVVSWP